MIEDVLTQSQRIRLEALAQADASRSRTQSSESLIERAQKFEQYILNGEVDAAKEEPQSNMVDHARRELELIGAEPAMVEALVKAVRGFVSYGHSGGSSSWAISVIYDLLQFKNISPLTDNPFDWIKVAEDLWQCRRNGEAFSTDGGKTYTLNSESLEITPASIHTSVSHLISE